VRVIKRYATRWVSGIELPPRFTITSVLVALTRLAQVVPGLRQRAYYDLNPVGKGDLAGVEGRPHHSDINGLQKCDKDCGSFYVKDLAGNCRTVSELFPRNSPRGHAGERRRSTYSSRLDPPARQVM
jgi:hypothetical protein